MIVNIVTKSNTNLLIITICMFIILRIARYINLFERIFFNLRFFIPKEVNDASTLYLTRINEAPVSSIERLSVKKFEPLQLSLLKLDENIHKLNFIHKQGFYSFYKTILVLFYTLVASQLLSQAYHCAFNNVQLSPLSSWNILLAVFTILVNYRFFFRIFLLSSYQSLEFKLSLSMGIITLFIAINFYLHKINSFSIFNFFPASNYFGLSIVNEIDIACRHINAIMALFSEVQNNISNESIANILYANIVIQSSLLTSCMTLATLKMTQITHYLFVESKLDKLKSFDSILLMLDIMLPLVLFFIFTPTVSKLLSHYLNDRFGNHVTINTCAIGQSETPISIASMNVGDAVKNSNPLMNWISRKFHSILKSKTSENTPISVDVCTPITMNSVLSSSFWSAYEDGEASSSLIFMIQIGLSSFSILIRFLCMKIYLQGYLDKTTYSLWHLIKLIHASSLSTFSNYAKDKMKLSYSQLVMTTSLLLNYPIVLSCLISLMLRLTPGCTFLCQYALTILKSSELSVYKNSIQQLYAYNATQHVIDSTGPPYFNDAIMTFLMSVGSKKQSVADKLLLFIKKISMLPMMPSDVTVSLIKKGISIFSLISFIINVVCIIYWLCKDMFVNETVLSQTSSVPNTQVVNSGQNGQHIDNRVPFQTTSISAQVEEITAADSEYQNMSNFDSKMNPTIKNGLN